MVFKLTVALVALASLVSAANYKRVVCPDGNVTTNEAVCFELVAMHVIMLTAYLNSAAPSSLCAMISRRTSSRANVARTVSDHQILYDIALFLTISQPTRLFV